MQIIQNVHSTARTAHPLRRCGPIEQESTLARFEKNRNLNLFIDLLIFEKGHCLYADL